MTQRADIGSRRLISLAPDRWVRWLLDDDSLDAIDLLSADFQWVSRESDVLIRVRSPVYGDFIVVNEIQLHYDARMPQRMRAYAGLANLCNEAALLAARHNKQRVEMADFQEAPDKIVLGTERAPLMDERERRTVAYHEAGHALVASLLPDADPVHRVTIIPRGRALGITAQLPEEERYNYSRDDLLTRLTVLMGGRAAEEIALGQMTTGAENDFQHATRLAQGMVVRWGMSETLGPVGYRVGETHPFLGRELALEREYSETTAAQIDQEVKRILQEAHQQAADLLTEHRPTLDRLAEALLQEETLDASQVAAIVLHTPARETIYA